MNKMPMKLEDFQISLLSDYKDEGRCFVRVNAWVGNLQISNPDMPTPIESLRAASGELIENIKKQFNLDEKTRDSLFCLSSDELFLRIYRMIYNEFDHEPTNLKSKQWDYFFGIPDGPEPFLAKSGFLLIDKTKKFGRFLLGKEGDPVEERLILIDNYIKKWLNLNIQLDGLIFKANNNRYNLYIEANGCNLFSDMLCDTNDSAWDRESASIKKVINFLRVNNLLKPSSIISPHPKISDLTELGWSLMMEIPPRWCKSKSFLSGNPHLSILSEKLADIRKRFPHLN